MENRESQIWNPVQDHNLQEKNVGHVNLQPGRKPWRLLHV